MNVNDYNLNDESNIDWIKKIDELALDKNILQELFGFKKKNNDIKQDPNIKYIEAKIDRKDALNKFLKLFNSLLKSSKYKSISKSVHVQDSFENDKKEFIDNSINEISVFRYNLWDYNKNARTDQELNDNFDDLIYSLINDCDKEMDKYGYVVNVDADWDSGSISLATDCRIDKLRRQIIR